MRFGALEVAYDITEFFPVSMAPDSPRDYTVCRLEQHHLDQALLWSSSMGKIITLASIFIVHESLHMTSHKTHKC